MELRNRDGTCLGPALGMYSNKGLLKADGIGVCTAIAEKHRVRFDKHLLGTF